MGNLRSPAQKLPLSTRKNLRDEWESKKSEYEAKISEILGKPWTIYLDANVIYSYADESYKNRLGSVIIWYMDPFVDNLRAFAGSFGVDGKEELNATCSKHQLIFGPQETTKFSYGGLVVQDGVLHLVFQENSLGTNVSDVSRDFAQALADAPPPPSGASPFNLIARKAVKANYDPEIEAVRSAIADLINMPNIKLNPNFEHNATELAKLGENAQGWERQLGNATLAYFQGVQSILERDGFKGDDMLQEGFQEGVEKGEICVRIVDKLYSKESYYNEVHIEDGVLYVQTTPGYWYTNTGDAAAKLMDLL